MIIAGVSALLNDTLRVVVTQYANTIRNYIVDDMFYLAETKKRHLNQTEYIKSLEAKITELEKNAILSVAFASELNKIAENEKIYEQDNIIKAKALSYKEIGNFGKVWLDFEGFKKDNIYGALYNGYTAGIVVEREGSPLALLQSSGECIFSVMVGENRVPGIIYGDGRYMEIKFIPPWKKIKEYDEVVTSGLDTIFFEGIKVGRVKSVHSGELYTTAVVEPYTKMNVPGYLYIVE
jgi:rod shape-determining protein MreC